MPKTKKPKQPDMTTRVAIQTEVRKAFWMEEAPILEILMALFQDADEVTFWRDMITLPDGSEQARYRVRAHLFEGQKGRGHDFGAMSSDEHGENIVDPFSEVLCAVLAAHGPRSTWGDRWMASHETRSFPNTSGE